ncbi:hypothetical protein EYF80_020739 [Liparis tanakae]|uniref:Uncharacterized protein n=1 Tax=Liparis tanakae TaxID=230148 RepID=A0A4Z2HT53_9TELE|nr:hypothetical protein EYF80_020739 [Liparis tanakae]
MEPPGLVEEMSGGGSGIVRGLTAASLPPSCGRFGTLHVALESLSPWEPVLGPWSFLELLMELLPSSSSAVGGFLSMASLGDVGCACSLLGSPVSVFISCLMTDSASSLTGGFSSPAWPASDPATSLSPVVELAFDLLAPSSLALLSSDECGEGKLSVSELLLAPPGRDRGQKETQIRRQDWAYTLPSTYNPSSVKVEEVFSAEIFIASTKRYCWIRFSKEEKKTEQPDSIQED